MSKYRIAYENAVASSEDLIRIYEGYLESGSFPPPEEDGKMFAAKFEGHHGQISPKSGWASLSRELRLVELGCGHIKKHGMSNAQVRAKVQKALKLLGGGHALLEEVKYEIDYVSALLFNSNHYAVRQREDDLYKLTQDLTDILSRLEENKPPTKWNARMMRQHRVRLAVLLTPLFEKEFGEKAKPCGGSELVDDAETNDWTRFYQMAASIFWGEHITPDRQAILWEACRKPLSLS